MSLESQVGDLVEASQNLLDLTTQNFESLTTSVNDFKNNGTSVLNTFQQTADVKLAALEEPVIVQNIKTTLDEKTQEVNVVVQEAQAAINFIQEETVVQNIQSEVDKIQPVLIAEVEKITAVVQEAQAAINLFKEDAVVQNIQIVLDEKNQEVNALIATAQRTVTTENTGYNSDGTLSNIAMTYSDGDTKHTDFSYTSDGLVSVEKTAINDVVTEEKQYQYNDSGLYTGFVLLPIA